MCTISLLSLHLGTQGLIDVYHAQTCVEDLQANN